MKQALVIALVADLSTLTWLSSVKDPVIRKLVMAYPLLGLAASFLIPFLVTMVFPVSLLFSPMLSRAGLRITERLLRQRLKHVVQD
jgi:hypothetical protein